MRFSAKTVTPLAIVGVLVASILTSIAPAQALSFDSIPAGWVYTYATPNHGGTAALTKKPVLSEKHANAKSTFIVNYTGVPEIEMPAIQAALDAWSGDYSSAVPIHVEATFTRQGVGGILASATPAKDFHAFKGAPVRLPSLKSSPAGLPVCAGSPNTPNKSSRSWKASP